MKKALVFDFDGVIHDTFDIAFAAHKAIHPNRTEEEHRSFFDGNFFETIKREPPQTQEQRDRFEEL